MKIKHRLFLSFCIIIILPMTLALVAITALSGFRSDNNSGYWSEGLQFSNSLKVIYENTDEEYQEIEKWVKESPEIFLQKDEMDKLNEELLLNSSCLIVRKANKIVYDGGKKRFSIENSDLPKFGRGATGGNTRLYVEGEHPILLRQKDFVFPDGNAGSIFLVSLANALLPVGKKMMVDILISVILILAFTASILILWIYRGVFSQVNKLSRAAENIKEGNLDFTISADGDDEMSVLVNTFESMRSRLEQDAKDKIDAENEQRQLISNIAHDLKTPLTSIRGYAEGLIDGVADTPQKQEAYLKTIDKKAQEMNTLLNELMLYSKLDTNRIPYDFKHQNVNAYFEDCVDELRIDLENQNFEITYTNKVDTSTQMISDPEQLMRVILNVIGNSTKYRCEGKGKIDLRVLDVGDFIQVEIEDNGKGIEAKDLPHIFDRMYRADASRNSNIHGSGIGLSVAKKIIEDHGGQIWATSKFGQGTVIYFVLRKFEEVVDGKDINR